MIDYETAARDALNDVRSHLPNDLSHDARRVAMRAAEIGIGKALGSVSVVLATQEPAEPAKTAKPKAKRKTRTVDAKRP